MTRIRDEQFTDPGRTARPVWLGERMRSPSHTGPSRGITDVVRRITNVVRGITNVVRGAVPTGALDSGLTRLTVAAGGAGRAGRHAVVGLPYPMPSHL